MRSVEGVNDNRQSVRVTSRMLFGCRKRTAAEYEDVLKDYNSGISLYNREELADIQMYIGAQAALFRLKEKNEELGVFLEHMDAKLNMLLKRVDSSPTLLDTLTLQKVNIGGNGLAFWSDESYAPNDMLEIYLVLSPGHIFIDCFGQVIQCEPSSGGGGKNRVSVRFVLIMDADRETLIQYNFKQQSLALQRRRIEKEQQNNPS